MPCHAIGRAAGWEWHDKRHALGGIRFASRTRNGSGQEYEDGGDAPPKIDPQSDLLLLFVGGWTAPPFRIDLHIMRLPAIVHTRSIFGRECKRDRFFGRPVAFENRANPVRHC